MIVKDTTQDRTRSCPAKKMLFMILVLAFMGWSSGIVRAQAAAQPPSQSSDAGDAQELLDGLLDLLVEPAPAAQPSGKTSGKATPGLTPADVGLDGEDLGKAGESPLEAVRQSMLIAAGYLKRGATNRDTLKLQADIVDRLDDLIHQLEKSQAAAKSSSEEQSQEQAASQQTSQSQRQDARQRSQTAARTAETKNAEDEQQGREGIPTGEPQNLADQRPGIRSLHAELGDPKALQQSVWGQLPERVRQQMQSRMVEQFLPAYREQIEAYFQALLK